GEEAGDATDGDDDEQVEQVGAEDALEEVPTRHVAPRRRQYKIQEVIKRRQILLIQVVKEERGQKGAAMTTYLSLAGRYSVLMPNTARGGGISRKIINAGDRRRLKTIAGELTVPPGMGVIVRTAGANRTKVEIKRDFDYLIRLWEDIRALTLQSSAPSLIYEEGSLIKRSIRDLYNKEIEAVLVDGEAAYKEAKAFMRMLMPSHSKNVKQYKDTQPLFVRHRVESQLHEMFSPTVKLPSGGYLVINQTEALVAIDVNSGKSTREHSIEDTARKTNLEAAEEVARQLRLRDLAGLVVIDFIDMDEKRNNRAVEQRLKEYLKTDRARIQVGRISHFGLMEMSRQRIRASVIEGTMDSCALCQGTGRIRSVSSTTLQIMREVEEVANAKAKRNLTVKTSAEISHYLVNEKRGHLYELGRRFGIHITVEIDSEMLGSAFSIIRGDISDAPDALDAAPAIQIDSVFNESDEVVAAPQPEEEQPDTEPAPRRRRRRSRGRRRGGGAAITPQQGQEQEPRQEQLAAEPDGTNDEAAASPEGETGDTGDTGNTEQTGARPARRRGRRGGRRQNRSTERPVASEATQNDASEDSVQEAGGGASDAAVP
ncbi:MAG: ribonuclease E/G, partial [Hyphomicrobiales bacterium]